MPSTRRPRGPGIATARRWAIGAVGGCVVILGLVLVPLPGPGWLVVFFGLGILATEFPRAERLLHWGRTKLAAARSARSPDHSAGVSSSPPGSPSQPPRPASPGEPTRPC
jgi:uncharacterized protein (TIGR02611 family)